MLMEKKESHFKGFQIVHSCKCSVQERSSFVCVCMRMMMKGRPGLIPVSSTLYLALIILYTFVERRTMRVVVRYKCLAPEHHAVPRPRLQPGLLAP